MRWGGGRCTGQRCHLIGCLAGGADCCFIPNIFLHREMFASTRTYLSKHLATLYKQERKQTSLAQEKSKEESAIEGKIR